VAGRFLDSDVATVRDRNPIDRVIAEYVALKPAGGGQLKGLCPFHDERSPSFQVSPAKGLYYCFGCGKGGDAIKFLQEIDHLSFAEAVERLAGKAGVTLTVVGGSASVRGTDRGQRTRLVEANAAAAEFYATQLVTDTDAVTGRRFLTERGFDGDAARHFGVGFAPKGWDALTKYLTGRGISREDLVNAGLAKESQRGSLIDRFRGRLLWPIRDLGGEVVGFGARKLFDDDQGPKYLNTPETPLFKKSRLLYGVDLAKGDIAKRREAVIVEGYTDVMACHLAGVTTAVATCGTSFGEDHVTVLRRLLMDADEMRGQVIFTFDGDAAGQKAAVRAAELDQRFSAQTYVAVAPGGQDPCELRQTKGDAAVAELIRSRTPLLEFVVRAESVNYDLDSAGGRMAALDKVVPLLRRVDDRGLRLQYADSAARILGFVDPEPVRERVLGEAARPRPEQKPPQRAAAPAPRSGLDPLVRTEMQVLAAVLQWPGYAAPEFDEIPAEAFTVEEHRAIREVIARVGGVAYGSGQRSVEWAATVLEAAPDDRIRDIMLRLIHTTLPAAEGDQTRNLVRGLVTSLRKGQIAQQLQVLKSRQLRMPESDPEYARLTKEIFELEIERRKLDESG
jgi:DNA primase